MFGPYWFGWDKFTPTQHLLLTWLIAIAVHVSAYWVLLANGWMQNPVGSTFNYSSYRMEFSNFNQLLTNPASISKYLHTVAASYVVSTATLLGISAYRLKRDAGDQVARLSYKLAAGLGLISIVLTVSFGDDTPKVNNTVQHVKQAIIFGKDDNNLLPEIEARIRSGIEAYDLLLRLRDGDKEPKALADFERYKADLGYALFLTPIHKQIVGASNKQIALAAQSVLPAYPGLIYWAYRLMIVCGVASGLIFVLAVWNGLSQKKTPRWLSNLFIYSAPVPWLATILGWFVAEVGKQPWAIAGILPTFLSVSSQSVTQLVISAIGFALAGLILLGLGWFLMHQAITNTKAIMNGGE